MDASEQFQLTLPATGDHIAGSNVVTTNKVVVIVGANGTGKTRLGSWIEFSSPQSSKVHRVGAQRSLRVASFISPLDVQVAEASLIFGYADPATGQLGNQGHKSGHKWGNEPNTFMMNDFDKLLTYLFSDEYASSIKYRQDALSRGTWEKPIETKMDIVKRIWEKVLPHRRLIVGGGKIEVAGVGAGDKKYHASAMSDGERVALYLIGRKRSRWLGLAPS